MRPNRCHMLAVAIALLVPAARLWAQEPQAASDSADKAYDKVYYFYYPTPVRSDYDIRFGWWGVKTSGSQTKVGEWGGLTSSTPFFDLDGLFSNGSSTLDFSATGIESESTQAGVHYYGGPGLTADIDYERFLHRLDHKLPLGFNDGPFGTIAPPYPAGISPDPGNVALFAQDLNAGQNYAIRVQEFKATLKGDLTENIRWRLNLWGLKKEGTRQASEMAHCYNLTGSTALAQGVNQVPGQTSGPRCHWLSQSQHIDWLTQEIEPVIEARLTDWLTLEYSRTMRTFEQDDAMVFRTHNGGGGLPGVGANDLSPYDVVPDTYTNIDRLKLFARFGEYTDAYLLGYTGDNGNYFRHTHRYFSGADARFTNRSIEGLELTAYGKVYTTHTTTPTETLNTQFGSNVWGEPTLPDSEPINRDYSAMGATSRWRPFHAEYGTLRSRMGIIGGYEYAQISRQNAAYELELLDPTATPPIGAGDLIDITFYQPDSHINKFFVGVTESWTDSIATNLKYTYIDTHYPLFGVTEGTKVVEDPANPAGDAINTSLPTHVDRVEIGGTWQPLDNFLFNATAYIENTYHRSPYAHFEEDSYPWMLSAWYAPTCKLSLSAGFAQLTNWIDQDITLGSQGRYGASGPNVNQWEETPGFTAPWRYGGKSDVVNLGSTYALTQRLSLTGCFEYVRARDSYATPPGPPTSGPLAVENPPAAGGGVIDVTPYTQLSDASRVEVETYRLSAGFDYCVRNGVTTFFRYNYYDYGDLAMLYNAGEAHMFLAGLSANY